jgi:hypothetical protein
MVGKHLLDLALIGFYKGNRSGAAGLVIQVSARQQPGLGAGGGNGLKRKNNL